MILIDSLYTNNSGGRVLLNYLVEELVKTNLNVFYVFDIRCEGAFDFIPENRRIYIKANLKNRRDFYIKNKHTFKKVLCFSNLPPPIKLNATTFTFFQNVILLERSSLLSPKSRLILQFKQLYLNLIKNNTDFFLVQTQNVKNLLVNKLNFESDKVILLPFFQDIDIDIDIDIEKKRENIFLYVSDGNPHKNHFKLLDAWEIINKSNPLLELHLTVSNLYPNVLKYIEIKQKNGVNILNHGIISKKELILKYKNSKYIIYPSMSESFGLGLVEGLQFGMEIIASDLPFVHSICIPFDVFNPLDINSISQCVLESSKSKEKQISKILVQNNINSWITYLT